MKTKWGAPLLAAGLIAVAATSHARAAYFGATSYSGEVAPTCCAQTHFVTACQNPGLETAGYSLDAPPAAADPGVVMQPVRETVTRIIYDTTPKTVTETIYQPVTETVMKEVKCKVQDTMYETRYREYTVTRQKEVCETEIVPQPFLVCKPVCETVYEERTRTVCKPVTETHYRESVEKVCAPVTETAVREAAHVVYREVTETVCQNTCKTVEETVTVCKTVARKVPEKVCESEYVPSHLAWHVVPKYECNFDPCTCSTCQKQVGTTRKLVREPGCTITREVVRCKTVIEQAPETKVVKKVVVEKVPTTVVKKVPVIEYEKVPVTVVRNVMTTRKVQVPYTVTRMVPSTETTREAVTVNKKVLGSYVESSALCKEAAEEIGHGRPYVCGGEKALRSSSCATYEACGPGRVFVEGLKGTRTITRTVTRTIPVCEVRKEACRVPVSCEREVIRKVPTTVTKMAPITVTKVVRAPTCRVVTEEVVRMAPVRCSPCDCAPCAPRCGPRCECKPWTPGALAPPVIICESSCSNPCGSPCGNPCSSARSGWLRGLCDRSCREHPVRDFFQRIMAGRFACKPCHDAPCSPCATDVKPPVAATPASPPAPAATPALRPDADKSPTTGAPRALPPIPPSNLPPLSPMTSEQDDGGY